jgi:predicted AlkP superfamily phosphohydrolase/phosphomutase
MKTAMKSSPKFPLFGFDAASQKLIFELSRNSLMPTVKRLLAKGLVGKTRSVPGFYGQCTWSAFYTGTGPAKLGVHSWLQLKPGTYEFYRAYTPDCVLTPPFWDFLSAAGRRVAILDVPHTLISERINGIQLVEWGAHDFTHGFKTSPPALAQEITARFGHYPRRSPCDADRTPEEFVAFRNDLLRGIEGKTAITKYILAQENWDFVAQVFTESHCVGHQCWHLHDRTHPRFQESVCAIVGDPVKDIYIAIDRAIGQILEAVDENTTVMIVASHGMNSKYGGQFLLGDVLVHLGVAVPEGGTSQASKNLKRALDPFLTWGWQQIPKTVKAVLNPIRYRGREWVNVTRTAPTATEPSAGKCFILTNTPTHGAIRLNLVGREPNGKIRPGDECEAFLDQLSRDLLQIKNVETGTRIVNRVIRTTDYYQSDVTKHFPDLLVEWTNAAPIRSIYSEKIGRIDKEYGYCRTGEHNPAGMFVACGPGIAAGQLNRIVSIMDFAPTICEALGVKADGFDGVSIPEISKHVGVPTRHATAVTA